MIHRNCGPQVIWQGLYSNGRIIYHLGSTNVGAAQWHACVPCSATYSHVEKQLTGRSVRVCTLIHNLKCYSKVGELCFSNVTCLSYHSTTPQARDIMKLSSTHLVRHKHCNIGRYYSTHKGMVR